MPFNYNNQYSIKNPYAYEFKYNQIKSKHHTHKIIFIDIIIAICLFIVLFYSSCWILNSIYKKHVQTDNTITQNQVYKYIKADKIGLGPKLGNEFFYKVHYNKTKAKLTVRLSPKLLLPSMKYEKVLGSNTPNAKLALHLIKSTNGYVKITEITKVRDILTQQLLSNMNLPHQVLTHIDLSINFPQIPTINKQLCNINFPLVSQLTPSLQAKYINNPDKLLNHEQHTHQRFLTISKHDQASENKYAIKTIRNSNNLRHKD